MPRRRQAYCRHSKPTADEAIGALKGQLGASTVVRGHAAFEGCR